MYSLDRLLQGTRKAQATVDRPLEHLVACHDRIEERLKTLERAAAALDTRPGEARDALMSVFQYFETSGILHTEDEERSVFPRMQASLTGEEREYMAELEQQHREAEALYARLKQAPSAGMDAAAYRDVVERFCILYRAHINSENTRLMEIAGRVLENGDLVEISREMRARRGWLQ